MEGETLLKQMFGKMGLSARGCHRILRVARTCADLSGSEIIGREHVLEACCFRNAGKKFWNVWIVLWICTKKGMFRAFYLTLMSKKIYNSFIFLRLRKKRCTYPMGIFQWQFFEETTSWDKRPDVRRLLRLVFIYRKYVLNSKIPVGVLGHTVNRRSCPYRVSRKVKEG